MRVLKLVFGLLLLLTGPAAAEQARIAVAANFRVAMQDLIADFTRTTPYEISVSIGASGQLFAQISNGAPFDVFLSADQLRPEKLIQSGFAVPGSAFTYATGRLYLLLREPPAMKGSVPDLSAVRRISLANPRTAPYGAAARQVLDQLEFPQGTPLIAQAQSIAGVNAAFASGAVDAGFAALASVPQSNLPPGWHVPETVHDPIRQDAVLLTKGADNPAATAFHAYLQSQPARALIRKFGYHVD